MDVVSKPPPLVQSSNEVSQKQDKAGTPEERHLPTLPSDWLAAADPEKERLP